MPVPAPLTVGIDARAAAEVPAGRGRVVRELLRGLARGNEEARFVLYAREPWGEPLDERFSWSLIGAPDPLWHLRAALRARGDDVFLSTNSYLTAWFLRPPSVVFVYDLVPWIAGAAAQKRAARIERATIRPAIRRASSLMCISRATQADLSAHFPAARPKSFVAPLAADEHLFAGPDPTTVAELRARHRLTRPFVFAAGTLEPRKNLPRLFAAYAALPADVRAANELVVVGPDGWEMAESLRAAHAQDSGVRLLGHVSDDELAALYSECAVFCYPSLYEGFGLPVLEAMAAGAPVLTSSVSSLPEVGGDAVAYCNPLDAGSIRDGLMELLGDASRRGELSAAGRERARSFSWDRFAAEIMQAARRAAGRE